MPSRRATPLSLAIRARSIELRRQQTPAEQMLWQRLRGARLGSRFRRQHPLGRFIADFCCVEHKLIVELDGPIHAGQADRDAERTKLLEAAGYRVLRFTNAQLLHDMDTVLAQIRVALAATTVPPLPRAGEGDRG